MAARPGITARIITKPVRPRQFGFFRVRLAASLWRARSPRLAAKPVTANQLSRIDMASFVKHLDSALDGTRFEPGQVLSAHQGRPLWVRYDLTRVSPAVNPALIAKRHPSLWRYRELLPLPLEVEPVT